MHDFTLFLHISFEILTNSHQSVQIPVNAFHIRGLVTWGVLILINVETWFDNASGN